MPDFSLLLAALFLPLFPLSMVFNALFNRVQHVIPRCVLLIGWPHIGLAIIYSSETIVPTWIITWALATSLLYALRMLALRGVGQWNSFLATSMWAMLWLTTTDINQSMHHLYTFGITVPLLLLALLSAGLEKRFGAAYTDLYGGLAQSIPRFAGVLVVVILAAIATPLFPGFFIMLKLILETSVTIPAATFALLGIWLLWSWAGVRLLQGLIVGPASPGQEGEAVDLNLFSCWGYAIALIVLMLSGIYFAGGLL